MTGSSFCRRPTHGSSDFDPSISFPLTPCRSFLLSPPRPHLTPPLSLSLTPRALVADACSSQPSLSIPEPEASLRPARLLTLVAESEISRQPDRREMRMGALFFFPPTCFIPSSPLCTLLFISPPRCSQTAVQSDWQLSSDDRRLRESARISSRCFCPKWTS